MKTGNLIWVCVDCMFAHANGEISPDADMPPLGRLIGLELALGGACECPNDECEWDGECDVTTFSSSPCQGCGSYLAGERHALTYWTEADRQYAVVDHNGDTLESYHSYPLAAQRAREHGFRVVDRETGTDA